MFRFIYYYYISVSQLATTLENVKLDVHEQQAVRYFFILI